MNRSLGVALSIGCLCAASWAEAKTGPNPSHAQVALMRARQSPTSLRGLLKAMPKGAELHVHLAGLPGPDRLLSLAAEAKGARYFVRVPEGSFAPDDEKAYALIGLAPGTEPTAEKGATFVEPSAIASGDATRLAAFRHAHTIHDGTDGDKDPQSIFYNATFARRKALVNSPEILPRMVVDAIRAAREHHVSYLELQIDPFHAGPAGPKSDCDRELSSGFARAQIEAMVEAAATENKAGAPVVVRFLLSLNRTHAKLFTLLPIAFELAAGRDVAGRAIAGIDVVSNEYARDGGLGEAITAPEQLRDYLITLERVYPSVPVSLHAGESVRYDWHVRDAVLSGATRIGHATNLDGAVHPEDVELLRHRGVLLETCLTSNRLLLGIDPAHHPFLPLFRSGIAVSLSTDDPGVFNTDMTEEFLRLVEARPDLTTDELRRLARAGLEHAFVDEAERAALIAAWEKSWAAWAK